jgi:creatinine amidohydrolase/Fe(II)-dependent formamide hydrolase-like protein
MLEWLRPGRRGLVRVVVAGAAALLGVGLLARKPSRAAVGTVEIADMTWMDVRDALAQGTRTVIVPTGGLEQNGPHMIIGKHDHVVAWAARRIALELGNTLVAPVVSYVPQGDYDPPTGHLRFPGTMGVSVPAFESVLDGIARSLKAGGFTTICFMSDHGGSVAPQARVVARLNTEWHGHGPKVIDVSAYYSDELEDNYLHAQGEKDPDIGQHGGIADTAELMAVYPEGVDMSRLPSAPSALGALGASGDPRRASFARGDALMALRIDAALRQIRTAMSQA